MEIVWVVALGMVFSLYDFLGYNDALRTGNPKVMVEYRVVQHLLLVTLALALHLFIDLGAALAFLLLWWTWVYDWEYYLWCEIWTGMGLKGAARREIFTNLVTWAWWTPYGLAMRVARGAKSTPISAKILVIQSIVGAITALVLAWRL